MNGQWVYSEDRNAWEHPITFNTKEQAIEDGKNMFDNEFYIGQLLEYHVDRYKVVFIEKVSA